MEKTRISKIVKKDWNGFLNNKQRKNYSKYLFGILGIALFIAFWQLLSVIKSDPAIVKADVIAKSFFQIVTSKGFYANLLATLKIVLIGIGIGTVVGIGLSILIDLFEPFKKTVNPLIEIFRNIPSITLFPILLVMYGIGDTARIFIIFWTATPAIIISSVFGLRSVNISIIEAAQSFGANKWTIMWRIKLPLAIPEILNGIRIGIGSGFVAIVVAEMLGASKGLGFMVLWSTNAFKYSETYAYIIIIGLIGAIVNCVMGVVIKIFERKYV